MEINRKLIEIEHGRNISAEAEEVWGWDTPAGKLRVQQRIENFLKNISYGNGKKILEIGCGTGIFTSIFYQNKLKLVGVDISFDLLLEARKKMPFGVFVQADVENLPFKENSFDCVIGVSILHHLDIILALSNIKTVLKQNGKIIFSEPNMANPQIFLQKNIRLIKIIMKDTPTETAFYSYKLRKVLNKLKFKEIRIYPFDFLHPFTPVFLIKFVKTCGKFLERMPVIKEIAGSLLIYAEKQ